MSNRYDFQGRDEFGFQPRYKNGKPRGSWIPNHFTILETCEHCGFTSTPRKVQDRNEAFEPNLTGYNTPKLCMACWNKFRVLVYEYQRVQECYRLINQLEKVRLERKRETNISRVA